MMCDYHANCDRDHNLSSDHQLYVKRAEKVSKLLLDTRLAYEADNNSLPNHWIDLTQNVAVGSQCSEVDVPAGCREDFLDDTVIDDFAMGVKIGRSMRPGDECFYASVDDSDGRHLHFFFVAPSESAVVEQLIGTFNGEKL